MVIQNYLPYHGHYQVYIGKIEQGTIAEITAEQVEHVAVAGKGFGPDLERIVAASGLPPPEKKYISALYDPKVLDEYLRKSHAAVTKEVDDLPADEFSVVLGMYDPNTDTVYIASGLAPHVKRFVLEHEYVHRERHFKGLSQDESLVDSEAQARIGYDPLQRVHDYAA